MKNLKIQNLPKGFMLAEVAIALAIMGILLTPILLLQYSAFKRVIINKNKIEHLVPVKQMLASVLIKPLEKDEKIREQFLEEPAMKLVYQQKKITGNREEGGPLARFKDLVIQKVTGTWQEWGDEKETVLMQLAFIPKPSNKKQEQ